MGFQLSMISSVILLDYCWSINWLKPVLTGFYWPETELDKTKQFCLLFFGCQELLAGLDFVSSLSLSLSLSFFLSALSDEWWGVRVPVPRTFIATSRLFIYFSFFFHFFKSFSPHKKKEPERRFFFGSCGLSFRVNPPPPHLRPFHFLFFIFF